MRLQEELETTLRQYLHEQYGGQSSVLVAIDGKTMRGTIPKGMTQGVHLLTAYLAEVRPSLTLKVNYNLKLAASVVESVDGAISGQYVGNFV